MSIDNIADLPPRVQYTATAGQTEFPYTFPIFQDADLVIDVDGSVKTLSDDYTVSGATDDTGGYVTFTSPLAGGEIVTIYRDTVIERTSDFPQNGPWFSDATNDDFDRLTVIAQELRQALRRSIRFPMSAEETDLGTELSPIDEWKSRFLYIDANGRMEPAVVIDGLQTLSPSIIGALIYPRTEAEQLASVTPTFEYYPPGDLRRYGGVGDGTTVADTALSRAAAQAAQTGGAVVVIAGGTYRISANATLGAGVTLNFNAGGRLSIDNGLTLYIQGSVVASPGLQIFAGSGVVKFGASPSTGSRTALTEIYPEWWGARADGVTDCTAAVAAAIAAPVWGGVVKFTAGVYMLDSITAAPGVALIGVGREHTLIKMRDDRTSPFVLLDNSAGGGILPVGGFRMCDLTLDGNGFAQTGCHGLRVNNYALVTLRDVDVYSFDRAVYFHGAISSTLYRCRLHNSQIGFEGDTDYSTLNAVGLHDCVITGNATWGVRVTGGSLFRLTGGSVEANGTAGNPNTGGVRLEDMDRDGLGVAAVIDGVWAENNNGIAAIVIDSPNTNYSLFSIRAVHAFGGTRTYGIRIDTSATFANLHLSHSSFKNAATADISVASATVGVIDNCTASTSSISSPDMSILANPANGRYNFPTLSLADSTAAPAAQAGYAHIYVDSADGDLKCKFADGVVKTLATDT